MTVQSRRFKLECELLCIVQVHVIPALYSWKHT